MNVQDYKGEDWRCTQDRFNRQIERAKFFEKLGATDLSIHYDANEDSVVTEFVLDGNKYEIQVYKIFTVAKNGHRDWMAVMRFYNEYSLFTFFEKGAYKNW